MPYKMAFLADTWVPKLPKESWEKPKKENNWVHLVVTTKANHQLLSSRGQNDGFSEEQIEMYKECFKLMDSDKVCPLFSTTI